MKMKFRFAMNLVHKSVQNACLNVSQKRGYHLSSGMLMRMTGDGRIPLRGRLEMSGSRVATGRVLRNGLYLNSLVTFRELFRGSRRPCAGFRSARNARCFSSQEQIATNNDRVSCHITVADPDKPGEFAMNTHDGKGFPLSFVVGHNQVIPGIDKQVEGMKVGETWRGVISADMAFGQYHDHAIFDVPLSPDLGSPKVGDYRTIATPQGKKSGKVLYVNQNRVKVDCNHELAGKDIKVSIELVEIENVSQDVWSDIELQTFEEGDGICFPVQGDSVILKYAAKIATSSEPFETSDDNGPYEFTVGDDKIIKGLNIAVQRMTLGEKARVFVPATLAYGGEGSGDMIPPYANLVYDLYLVGVNDQILF